MAISRSALAKAGFFELEQSAKNLTELAEKGKANADSLITELSKAAEPDQVVSGLLMLGQVSEEALKDALAPKRLPEVVKIFGASAGLIEFFCRHPELLKKHASKPAKLLSFSEYCKQLRSAVAGAKGAEAGQLLRKSYREQFAKIASFDLSVQPTIGSLSEVTAALSDLAASAIEVALEVAKTKIADTSASRAKVLDDLVFAIIGMGKLGARELNYLSDVDLIFVAANSEGQLEGDYFVVAEALAKEVIKILDSPGKEPGLWKVDTALRPEGKSGALVRSVDSHRTYYERWAESWEFQALLKARPIAGDFSLGEKYVDALSPMLWSISQRDTFVADVQAMRSRVTSNIPSSEVDRQLKLGPGGLRDIEFTIQLLQLVHGRRDESIRAKDTLGGISALASAGYIGREDAAVFAQDYLVLRQLEHGLQLQNLRRVQVLPTNDRELRHLARATRLAATSEELLEKWQQTKISVRQLHTRLFYAPLLSASSSLDDRQMELSTEEAKARLAAIGFADPNNALIHINALTQGVSRRAAIHRHLLPVLLQWFAEGNNPDLGLLTYRRLSEELGENNWWLRMLRDSHLAAKRLATLVTSSKFITDLLLSIPESAAWLGDDNELTPRSQEALDAEVAATRERYQNSAELATALRTLRRREVLRLAIGFLLQLIDVVQLGPGISAVHTSILEGLVTALRRENPLAFTVIAMGRFGGSELGFSSDLDVIYVYDQEGMDEALASERARTIVSQLGQLTSDPILPLELDSDLRPEGKQGAPVRSLDSYREYYSRWGESWESQALLRARPVAGNQQLAAKFVELINVYRYPKQAKPASIKEIRAVKARVESERLPQGADPNRHLKLGRGSLSDVEWLVQLLQFMYSNELPKLQTTSTLKALSIVTEAGLIDAKDANILKRSWRLASSIRSALMLANGRPSDILPIDRNQLEALARILGYRAGSASKLEEFYLATTRKARQVFENNFYALK